MSKVYLTSCYRTAVGKFLSSLKDITPVDLATQLVNKILENDSFPKEIIDGYIKIKAGFNNVILVGGVESMSQAGYILLAGLRSGAKMGDLSAKDIITKDGLTDAIEGYHMSITAENLASKYQISREEQDKFAVNSQLKAIESALSQTKMNIADINTIELNEAFAAQSLAVIKQLAKNLNVTEDHILSKANPNGGAIAIGHPLGASGARIVATLVHEMKREKRAHGLASLCIGGGMGVAMIFKNVEI